MLPKEIFTIKTIEKLGWKLDNSYEFGDNYKWNKDWNGPTLFIGKKTNYVSMEIRKFGGRNSWYGKMQTVFKGECETLAQFKLICKLVKLDDYWKGKL